MVDLLTKKQVVSVSEDCKVASVTLIFKMDPGNPLETTSSLGELSTWACSEPRQVEGKT